MVFPIIFTLLLYLFLIFFPLGQPYSSKKTKITIVRQQAVPFIVNVILNYFFVVEESVPSLPYIETGKKNSN